MKFCARCDLLILPGEEPKPVAKFSPSGGGITLYVHADLCKSAQIQTSPVSGPAARRGEAAASNAP